MVMNFLYATSLNEPKDEFLMNFFSNNTLQLNIYTASRSNGIRSLTGFVRVCRRLYLFQRLGHGVQPQQDYFINLSGTLLIHFRVDRKSSSSNIMFCKRKVTTYTNAIRVTRQMMMMITTRFTIFVRIILCVLFRTKLCSTMLVKFRLQVVLIFKWLKKLCNE